MEKLMCLMMLAACHTTGGDDVPGRPADDCALGAWELVMTTSPGGDCNLDGGWQFKTTYVVTGGRGSYSVVDEDRNQVSLDLSFSRGGGCHAEFFRDRLGVLTIMKLDADAAGHVAGHGTWFGDDGCLTDFSAAGTKR